MNTELKTELETERRFLLKALPLETDNCEEMSPEDTYDIEYFITQHYLSSKKDLITKRIRHIINKRNDDIKFIYTEKERVSDITCNESEKEISIDEYHDLATKSKRTIFKTRYVYQMNNLKWEIDCLDHESGLIIAEIELPSEDYDLKIPKFIQEQIIYEVSGIKEFSNSSLAI